MSSLELLLTLFVALIVFGPNKLPLLAEALISLLKQYTTLKNKLMQIWQETLLEQELKTNQEKAKAADLLYEKGR